MFKLTFFFLYSSSEFLLVHALAQIEDGQSKIDKEQDRIMLNRRLIEEYAHKLNHLNEAIKVRKKR